MASSPNSNAGFSTPAEGGRLPIRFYNSLTHGLEPFTTVEPGLVRMYNCGPTVYDDAHIGNFRSFVFADLLRRFLEFAGHQVTQVMNITDVGHMTEDHLADGGGEDKMALAGRRLKEAKKTGAAQVQNPDDPYQVAGYFMGRFLADAGALGLRIAQDQRRDARLMPRATAHIQGMQELIGKLIERGHAYIGGDGAVYYDVTSFPEYGRLSGNTLDKVRSGAGGRISAEELAIKRNPADFLLWKCDSHHLMRWPSPWGEGYPGWHIECSAMAMGVHGVQTLDIHTGGEDNIFPHHECEIAQSTGATGRPFANFWLHARFLMVEGQKMSKSKGNFHTIRQLMEKGIDPAVLRYELLRTHYRSNMNFTLKGLEDSQKAVQKLRAMAGRTELAANDPANAPDPATPRKMGDTAVERDFAAALADDLNISGALGVLFKWLSQASGAADELAALRRMDWVLGILDLAAGGGNGNSQATGQAGCGGASQTSGGSGTSGVGTGVSGGMDDDKIQALCRQIDAARAARDFPRADAIRKELLDAGIEVQSSKTGTTWKRKMTL